MGRPGRPKSDDPRMRQLKLNLTMSEFAEINRRAHAFDLRLAHYVRNKVLEENPENPTDHVARNIQRLILDQLRRIGNNLNQLVKRLHFTGEPLPRDLEPLLTDIRNLIAKVRG
jgi:hypothetical protein